MLLRAVPVVPAALGPALLLALAAPVAAQDESLLLTGDADSDRFGAAVAGAGDIDLDGVPDLMVGAPSDDNTQLDAGMGRVYSGAGGQVLSTFDGSQQNDSLGRSVAGGGDVN
ncbi:MAG: integrin alpha, partial [Planctomycetota bacterium JB042]